MSKEDDDGDTIDRLKEVFDVLVGITETDTIQALVGKYLLLEGGTMTGVINSTHILPKTDLAYNLGSLSYRFKNIYGTLIGNANSATKLQTARKFTIGGVERTFDGSANVTITKSDMGLNNVQNTAFYKRVTTINGS
jgi:hypothetical protein